ncbi:MAG: hypothetical protein E3J78_06680 [Candidatus Cloacimonadota bacterium]|nr:MAG: hypothetical protein E3J78_06680 [Candidatus Cloacimonadota bacterium]
MKKHLLLFAALCLVSFLLGEENTLNYMGYTLEKQITEEDGYQMYIMILTDGNGNVIKKFDLGADSEEWNSWKLLDVIKGGNKELLISQYSGGAHCCEYNWIYEFTPEVKEIFNSYQYNTLGFMAPPDDLNNDGNDELILQDLLFSYFYRCCYAASPSYSVIFEYDPERQEYVVQNSKFREFLIPEEPDIFILADEFEDIKTTDNPDEVDPGGYYLGSVLNEVIPFFYAGEIELAWRLFDTYYILEDKTEIKELMIKRLESDSCFIIKEQ